MYDTPSDFENYLIDTYEPLEVIEKLGEYLTIYDLVDIIKEYNLEYIFLEDKEEPEDG